MRMAGVNGIYQFTDPQSKLSFSPSVTKVVFIEARVVS
jgi:hypothetical protein